MMSGNLSSSQQEQGFNMLISKYFNRAVVGLAALMMMTVSAAAQSKVLVVDSQRIVSESEVGKHVKRQIEAIGKTMSSELKSTASPLQTTGQSLNAELQGKTPAEQKAAIQSRPDLQKKYVEFLQTENTVKQQAQVKKYEMAVTEQKAKIQIATKMQEIIEAIAKERGADVVLDKSTIIYGDPVDITDAVMSRLNSQMTRISVVRERAPTK